MTDCKRFVEEVRKYDRPIYTHSSLSMLMFDTIDPRIVKSAGKRLIVKSFV